MSTSTNREELKYNLSVKLIEHISSGQGMTASEYGSVYDSEEHERLLIQTMELIDSYVSEQVRVARIEEVKDLKHRKFASEELRQQFYQNRIEVLSILDLSHSENCNWQLADCSYRKTHEYCPHEEHACNCIELQSPNPQEGKS